MEYPCHRCGARIEEGTAFCPNCGAPQIRVTPEEPPVLPPGTPDDVQPPAQPVALGASTPAPYSPTTTYAPPPARVNWSHAFGAAALAGAVLAVSSLFPPLMVCLWVVAAGVLAVALYRRRTGEEVTPAMGAKIGAVSGILAFAVFAGATALQLLVSRNSGNFRNLLQQALEQQAAKNPDPRVQDMLQRMLTPEGLAFLVTAAMVLFFFGFLVFACAGGAIGASLLRPRDRRQ